VSTLADPSVSPPARAMPHHARHASARLPQRPLCAVCAAGTVERVLDLGPAPVVIGAVDGGADMVAPLRVARCDGCGVLQLADTLSHEARHLIATTASQRAFAGRPDSARRFCEEAIDRWRLRGDGHVIEIGSGTGSLLRFFRAWQLPVLGIEPDARLTRFARLRRIPTWRATFDAAVADRIARSDMDVDMVIVSTPTGGSDDVIALFKAVATVLRPSGVLTFEVPDVLRIVGRTRFDGLRHADAVLPSIGQLQRMVAEHGLDLVDVERGGPTDDRLRVWIRASAPGTGTVAHPRLRTRLRAESSNRSEDPDTIAAFTARVEVVRRHVRGLLDHARTQRWAVALWGTSSTAVAMAFATGVSRGDVAYAVDPEAVSTCAVLQGTDIPILAPADLVDRRPDLVLALEDLPLAPPGWEGVPIYAVSDLVDVVHRMSDAAQSAR